MYGAGLWPVWDLEPAPTGLGHSRAGRGDGGDAQIRQGFAGWRAMGMGAMRPLWVALLAEACGKVGQLDEGLRALEEALAAVQHNEEGHYAAEVYRLKGELLLAQAGNGQTVAEAEACFQQALDVARRRQAKSWEVRAALSLSRLWQCQGKCTEAQELLAPIYGWFTEGFDTADLQEASALLEALS